MYLYLRRTGHARAYDSEGRLKSITNSIGEEYTYEYNDMDRIKSYTVPGKGTTIIGWNNRFQPLGSNNDLYNFTFEHDVYNRLIATRVGQSVLSATEYDGATSYVLSESYGELSPSGAISTPGTEVFYGAYDPLGRPASVSTTYANGISVSVNPKYV